MNIKLTLIVSAIAIVSWGISASTGSAQDRTIKEFQEYVKQRLPDRLSEAQLNHLAKIVDENSDGTISEAEFEKRMEAVQKVMADKEAIERKAKQDTGKSNKTKGDKTKGDKTKGDKTKGDKTKGDKTKSGKSADGKKKSARGSRWEQMNQRMQAQLERAGISPGKSLPDVAGLDIEGKPFKLADLKGHYSVIVNGCLT